MWLCSDDHEEIVYTGRRNSCPLCHANDQVAELEKQLDESNP